MYGNFRLLLVKFVYVMLEKFSSD